MQGRFTAADAASIRAGGEHALDLIRHAQPRFNRDWSAWRPDRTWTAPILPREWALYEVS